MTWPQRNRIRSTIGGVLLSAVVAINAASRAADETCIACDVPVEVNGEFSHYKIEGDPDIQGALGDPGAFREEIWGPAFTISVPHLPAGRYTVIIGEMEGYFTATGQRCFDISLGDTLVASNLDVYATAGGANKVLYLTNLVDHADDSLRGPLQVKFAARVNNAKFNTFEIRNSSGGVLISTKAAELADSLVAATGDLAGPRPTDGGAGGGPDSPAVPAREGSADSQRHAGHPATGNSGV